MKVIILAAGKGERMRPLTLHTPKPLLKIGAKSILEWHLDNLVEHGFRHIVINNAWLGQQVIDYIGTEYMGAKIIHSSEKECLETAGGIANALEHLNNGNDEPFLVLNGDTFIPKLPIQSIKEILNNMPKFQKGHLYLVDNPAHNKNGDFYLQNNSIFYNLPDSLHNIGKYTFSGIGIYRPSLFNHINKGEHAKLLPILVQGMQNNMFTGEKFSHMWMDIGTVERLEEANKLVTEGIIV